MKCDKSEFTNEPKKRINRLNLREVEARVTEPRGTNQSKQPMEIATIW